jgi:hypothetical protein
MFSCYVLDTILKKVTKSCDPAALPDLWLKLYKEIQFDFTELAESLATPRH